MRERIDIIAGRLPIPEGLAERVDLLEFADAHHVLGQLAVTWLDSATGKTAEVLENGLFRAMFDHQMLRFEMDRLERALLGSGISPVILKGGAYVATGSKAGLGRRVSDLDILVSKDQLEEVELLLKQADWEFESGVDNAYDSGYYRKYMHELPPLRHKKRRTLIDVHHKLVPQTSRYNINSDLMIEAAKRLPGTRLRTFTAVDQFIHSAVHSFADGAFDTPTRSVLELYLLFSELSSAERGNLGQRAKEVGASRPVSVALWILAESKGEKPAEDVRRALSGNLVKYAFKRKLQHPDANHLAKLLLFVRSHLIRMPLHLLAAHSIRKFLRSIHRLTATESQQGS